MNFFRCLLATLLPQYAAKCIQVDGCFRLAKSNRALADVPRDVLVHFPLLRDKLVLQDTGKNRALLPFEEMQLQFLQDMETAIPTNYKEWLFSKHQLQVGTLTSPDSQQGLSLPAVTGHYFTL
ncbi:Hypothetical predicted protein [Pelobates cultripes]|uniref:Uncharacterized protein n=1 Tax=Pelobates cultripes TaxID=61616 RepID=A0AAD1RC24_PELCU|nr:Hypothetical predicted protein [Pelobates cultripes]